MAVIDGKILLADDEKDIADVMEEVLRQDGFRDIRKAYNGADAVNICREFQPDAVILNITLPDIDGLSVCGRFGSSPIAWLCPHHQVPEKARFSIFQVVWTPRQAAACC